MRPIVLLLVLAVAACGCSTQSPVASSTSPTRVNAITEAHVLVNGTPVEGTTVSSHGPTLFEARLRDRDAASLAQVQLRIHYEVPAGPDGMMMGHRSGETPCHDDGTHGDDVAGDGVCHWLDAGATMGCGAPGAPAGTYSYTFRCRMLSGASCGELMLGVTRR